VIVVIFDKNKISHARIRGTHAGTGEIGLVPAKQGLISAQGRLAWAGPGLGLREQGLTSAEQRLAWREHRLTPPKHCLTSAQHALG
jgi:hypothetical protein